ncbi:hypothetical protein [Streptomyces antibioticus]|uniref:hypothetical protein n=1 Tax=Streptomyces antibioticus TaxID=1890 RepID=UPI003F4D41F4
MPLTARLGVLGGTGLTAYAGLTRIARLREGDELFVPAAAGGVGTATGRFRRLLGAGRLLGSAGSAAEAGHPTREVGHGAVFDHHAGAAAELLAEVAPDGFDVFVDFVDAFLGMLRGENLGKIIVRDASQTPA